MKSILCNLQLFHFKHFLKTGRSSVISTSVRCFSNSLFGCPTSNDWDSQKRKDLLVCQQSIRSLNMSVKKLDKLSEIKSGKEKKNDLSIIYVGGLTHRVKGVKVFTCATSITGIIIQSWMYQNIMNGSDIPLGIVLISCVGFFTWVTPFLCHAVAKKYVTEIWYNSATNTYRATLLSFFLRKINIDFKIEDIRVPDIPPLFTTMYLKGRPVFIVSDSFLEIEHYIKFMGYDKPIDMNLSSISEGSDKSEKEEKPKPM